MKRNKTPYQQTPIPHYIRYVRQIPPYWVKNLSGFKLPKRKILLDERHLELTPSCQKKVMDLKDQLHNPQAWERLHQEIGIYLA